VMEVAAISSACQQDRHSAVPARATAAKYSTEPTSASVRHETDQWSVHGLTTSDVIVVIVVIGQWLFCQLFTSEFDVTELDAGTCY